MAPSEDPSYYRRRVRSELRKARDAAGLTQRQAVDALDWSLSKLVRIEAGTVGVSTTDLKALLGLYKVTDESTVAALVAMAKSSKREPWYSQYAGRLPPEFAHYLGYEESASVIRTFQPLAVAGLLQTADYARAIFQAHDAERPEERVTVRLARQELLNRDNCPDMCFIFDEAALRRHVGGPDVMRRQLHHLLSAMSHPKVSVRVVPFDAGAYPAMRGSFTILEFADWDQDVLYLETARGSVTTREDHDRILRYREKFDLLRAMSLDERETGDFVASLIDRIGRGDGTVGQDGATRETG